MSLWLAPWMVWAFASVLCWAPVVAHPRRHGILPAASSTLLLGAALATESRPAVTASLLALTTALHAWQARPVSRAAMGSLAVAASLLGVVSVALVVGAPEVALLASLGAISFSAGVMPAHVGVASLASRAPEAQVRTFAAVLVLVWVHARDLDHLPLAADLAPWIVRFAAVVTLIPALTALVARTARDLYRATVVTHAGMLLMAVGVAGHGHYAAALFAALTMGLAMGGLGLTIAALEARAGEVQLNRLGGRAASFPKLSAAFAVFAAAGVGLPGTAGFIADDLLLHAVWGESAVGAVVLILAAALLAVATLRGFALIFLGPPQRSVAFDLVPRERWTLVALLTALLVLGVTPQVFVTPASLVLGTVAGGPPEGGDDVAMSAASAEARPDEAR